MSEVIVIGTSHKLAPVEVRSRLAIAEEEMPAILRQMTADLAEEAAILNTCNRTEFYLAGEVGSEHLPRLIEWLENLRGIEIDREHVFGLTGPAAARHLMEVASSIDSQVIGDIQVIGQVRSAYQAARDTGTLGKHLTRVFETALRAGKRVKNETALYEGAVSISYVAVELARKIFYPLEDQRTLVLGAGETGELTAVSLRGRGVHQITLSNRTEERGRELIERLGFGEWLPFDRVAEELAGFDIVIVATGATRYVLTYEMVRAAVERRSQRPMLIVDLAVPRNVDPAVASLDNVFCKDLNDLNGVVESNVERRKLEIPEAEAIVGEELEEYNSWRRRLPVTPVIADLRRQADSIAESILRENRGRFDDETFRNVERLVSSVVKRIISLPMSHLLSQQDDPEQTREKAEHIRVLFNLQEKSGESSEGSNSERRAGS